MSTLEPAGVAIAAELGQRFQCAPVDLDEGVPFDIYALFHEVTGRDYDHRSDDDERAIVEYAHEFETAAGLANGTANTRRCLADVTDELSLRSALTTYIRKWEGRQRVTVIDNPLTLDAARESADQAAAEIDRKLVLEHGQLIEVPR